MTNFLYRNPKTGTIFLVAGNTRQPLDPIQRDLYVFAAALSGTPLVNLGDLKPAQIAAIERTPLVGKP